MDMTREEKPMGGQFVGILIRRERLRKNWSQEGLCQGICAVSYLSKIEQGKAEAGREVIRPLLERLGTEWHDEAPVCRRAAELAERMYDAFFSLDKEALAAAGREMDAEWETLSHGPRMLDFLLFRAVRNKADASGLREFAGCFDLRQRTLWMLLQKKYAELLRLNPSACVCLAAGAAAYRGGNYPVALERLQRAYKLAAAQGYARIMLESRVFIGNCYSNTMEFDRMRAHFRVAERLAAALGDRATLDTIRYNIQSTNLELGHTEESYAYFSGLSYPDAMALHKLAVCCEKLGKKEEALDAVRRAERQDDDFPPKDMVADMCGLIRYRLEHPGYLKEAAYGEKLLACFARLRRELPSGFAGFHLPWVLEWYTASRQYKQAFELMLHFPYYAALKRI